MAKSRYDKRIFYLGPDGHTYSVSSSDPQVEIIQYVRGGCLIFKRQPSDWEIFVPAERILRADYLRVARKR